MLYHNALLLLLVAMCCVSVATANNAWTDPDVAAGKNVFGFGHFSRTNGANITLPTSSYDALDMGWKPSSSGACVPGFGVEYVVGGKISPYTPLSLFFGADSGVLMGLAVRAWFDDSNSFNSDAWEKPVQGAENDPTQRWVTVLFRDPSGDGCSSDESTHIPTLLGDGALGDRLIVNHQPKNARVGGHEFQNVDIPLFAPTQNQPWYSGACMPDMSRHWLLPANNNATQLYGYDRGKHVLPVVPMYADPVDNHPVTALAFFATTAQVTQRDGYESTLGSVKMCIDVVCV
jgi:hypothetical protein